MALRIAASLLLPWAAAFSRYALNGGSPDVTSSVLSGYYTIPETNSGFTVTTRFVTSTADWKNSFGIYFVNENGEPFWGVLIFRNLHSTTLTLTKEREREVVTKFGPSPGNDGYAIPTGAQKFGFFLIPDGFNKNSNLSTAETDVVTFHRSEKSNIKGQWAAFLENTELIGMGQTVPYPAFFTHRQLNPDGKDHLKHNRPMNSILFWEDGGNANFRDAEIHVEIQGEEIEFEEPTPSDDVPSTSASCFRAKKDGDTYAREVSSNCGNGSCRLISDVNIYCTEADQNCACYVPTTSTATTTAPTTSTATTTVKKCGGQGKKHGFLEPNDPETEL